MGLENVCVVRVHFSGPPPVIVPRPPEKKPRLDVAEQVHMENEVDENGMPSPMLQVPLQVPTGPHLKINALQM